MKSGIQSNQLVVGCPEIVSATAVDRASLPKFRGWQYCPPGGLKTDNYK